GDPLGNKTTYAFDNVGRMTSLVTPKGNVKGGHPANFTWAFTYDAYGNRLTITDPISHRTTFHYDADENQDRITDANGNITVNVYDAVNELTQIMRPDSPQTVLTTDYNPDGTIADEKDGKGNRILAFGYNALRQLTSVTDALGNVTTFGYDAAGNRITKQDPGGNCSATPPVGCTTFTYDSV